MRLGDLDALKNHLEDLRSYTMLGEGSPYYDGETNALSVAIQNIEKAPTVDDVPMKYGRWIVVETEDAYDMVGIKTWALRARCSECGFVMKFIEAHMGQYIYCPNCGAKMDGERRESDG